MHIRIFHNESFLKDDMQKYILRKIQTVFISVKSISPSHIATWPWSLPRLQTPSCGLAPLQCGSRFKDRARPLTGAGWARSFQ